jgi:hypothetical protein
MCGVEPVRVRGTTERRDGLEVRLPLPDLIFFAAAQYSSRPSGSQRDAQRR